MLIHYCFKLLMYGFIQNLLVDWIKLNRLPSKSQVLLNQIAIKMVSLRVPETALLILEWLLTDHPLKIVGDSGPTERQVSPEKLYRAALLKNRFADTILKARERHFHRLVMDLVSPVSVSLLCEHYPIWM
jgi:hypothetical protein